MNDNQRENIMKELLVLYQDHSQWTRHFQTEGSKIHSVSLALVVAAFALSRLGEKVIFYPRLTGVFVILLGCITLCSNFSYYTKSISVWTLAKKIRRKLDSYGEFQDAMRRSGKHIKENHKYVCCWEKKIWLPDTMTFVFWCTIDAFIILFGILLILS